MGGEPSQIDRRIVVDYFDYFADAEPAVLEHVPDAHCLVFKKVIFAKKKKEEEDEGARLNRILKELDYFLKI